MSLHVKIILLVAILVPGTGIAGTPEPQVFANGIISNPVTVGAPAFTPDGETVYFHRKEGDDRTIYMSHKDGETWSRPIIAPFARRWANVEPAMAPDGSYMVFASNRPIEPNSAVLDGTWSKSLMPGRGGNLWRVDRIAGGWSAPRRLPSEINQGTSVFAPAIGPGGTLLFMRPVAENVFHLFEARPHGATYSVQELSFSKTGVSDFDPVMGKDGSYIIFCSQYRNNYKPPVIYITFRTRRGDWSEPARLLGKEALTTNATQLRLSPDETTLYYTQDDRIWSQPIADIREQMRRGIQ